MSRQYSGSRWLPCKYPASECPLVNTPLGMPSRQYSGSPWLPAVLRASSAKSSEKPELESVST